MEKCKSFHLSKISVQWINVIDNINWLVITSPVCNKTEQKVLEPVVYCGSPGAHQIAAMCTV